MSSAFGDLQIVSDPIVIHGTPPVTDATAVRLADMLGTGTEGVLWTYDFGAFPDSTCKFLDLTGEIKPYVLDQMEGGGEPINALADVEVKVKRVVYARELGGVDSKFDKLSYAAGVHIAAAQSDAVRAHRRLGAAAARSCGLRSLPFWDVRIPAGREPRQGRIFFLEHRWSCVL